LINVSAKDKASNKEQKITIQGGTGLSDDEIEKMVHDAESFAEDDKKKKEEVEARNIADSLVYTAEKSLKDAGDKVPDDIKSEIEEKVKALKEVIQTANKEELTQKSQDLSTSLQKIGEHLYKEEAEDKSSEDSKEDTGSEEPVEGEVVEE
jgi:molecular chaperone DnaK